MALMEIKLKINKINFKALIYGVDNKRRLAFHNLLLKILDKNKDNALFLSFFGPFWSLSKLILK